MTAIDRLLAALNHFAPDSDEAQILADVADGLVRGLSVYGPLRLDSDGRDMRVETLMETRDAIVYVHAALLRERRNAALRQP
jgi:hypothetical protein